jgi:MFS family permease
VLGAVIMGTGKSIPVLAVGRSFTGLSAATWVLLIAVFSTFFDADKAVLSSSMLSFSANFGRLLATASTGFLNRVGGYSLAFYLAGMLGVVAIVMVLFVREVRLPPMQVSLRSVGELFLRRDVMMPSVFSLLVHYADWSVTFGFLPVLAQEMGMGDVFKSLLISLNIAGIVVANLLNTLLVRKIGHGTLLSTGALLMFAGIVVIAYSPVRAFLFVGTVSMGFAFGMVYPILMGMSIQQVDRSKRSTAMGIHQSVYATCMFVGPWIAGNIADRFGIQPSFYITAVIYLVLVLALLFYLFGRGRSKAYE